MTAPLLPTDPLAVLVAWQLIAPAAALAAIGLPALVGRPLGERPTTRIVAAAFFSRFVAALVVLAVLVRSGFDARVVHLGRLFEVGHHTASIDLVADGLSVPYVCFSTGLCSLVNAFAGKYLHREPGFVRFFILLALFGTGMNLMVLAGSIDALFAGWEFLGISGASLATALVVTMPQVATYTGVRLLVGHADGVPYELVVLANAALLTATYGAALAVVQRDVRGLVGMLAMSQSAMVFAGLSGTVPTEIVGALAVWVSSGLALTGIGLVTWALESRGGRISIETLQGRFADAPALAAFFLLFGLAALGFPGTLSFVADDLMIAGTLDDHVHAGLLVILTTVFAAIAVVRGWFRVFGGPVTVDAPRHAILPRERIALTGLLVILFGLGLYPGPFVRSLDKVAASLLASRHHDHAAPASSGDHR
jgi:formate hydrogenlyase subunit 3/multisubunit Na+/H+ antiporter MnhD subunit